MRDPVRAEARLWPELETESFAQFEDEQESMPTDSKGAERPFSESEEAELATGFLEISDARQLDRFLGGLIQRATRTLGGVGNSRLGRVLGGMLKSLAKDALPGRGPDPTGMSPFAPEMESLPSEEQEFEVARRFVRFAGAAARRTARVPASATPTRAARSALRAAAYRHAPGLLRRRRPRHGIHGAIEPTVSTCDGPTCDEPSIRECRCDCLHHRGRRVIVINL
jgi:hypothetical protein